MRMSAGGAWVFFRFTSTPAAGSLVQTRTSRKPHVTGPIHTGGNGKGKARPGVARLGGAWQGKGSYGASNRTKQGAARPGLAGHGEAWQGSQWLMDDSTARST
jgi:hypothetical protein